VNSEKWVRGTEKTAYGFEFSKLAISYSNLLVDNTQKMISFCSPV